MRVCLWITIFGVVLCDAALFVRAGPVRVAVVAQRGETASQLAALVEAGLSDSKDVTLLEREKIDAVLQEQQLQAAFSAEGVGQRVAMGKIMQADVLVLLQAREKPAPAIDVVVCETHLGLRLLSQAVPQEPNGQETAKTIQSAVAAAIARNRQPITTIIAVPPLACNDVTIEYQHLGPAYARLIEQEFLGRRGTLVVELAEAQALGKELQFGDRSNVARPLPLYLLGEFRDDGRGDKRRTDLHLWLKRGDREVGTKKQNATPPEVAAQALQKMAEDLLDEQGAAPAGKPDTELEVKELLTLARQFEQVGQPDESLPLYEASLLLKEQAEGHRGAGEAIINKYRIATAQQVGLTIAQVYARNESVQAEMKPLLLAGLAHAEEYMRLMPLEKTNYFLFLRYMPGDHFNPFPVESTDAFIRGLALEQKNNIHDDRQSLWVVARSVISNLDSSQQQWEFALRMVPYVTTAAEGQRYQDVLLAASSYQDTPELRATLAAVAGASNPIAADAARKVPADIARMRAALEQRPEPKFTAEIPDIWLVRSPLHVPDAYGLGKAGANCDVFCTDSEPGPHSPYIRTLWVARSATEIHRLCDFQPMSAPCWDGKFMWIVAANPREAKLLVVNPETGEKWKIDASSGLPIDPMTQFVAAPLGPGKICAAAAIGAITSMHTWMALINFDPLRGGRVSVFHEARKVPHAVGVDANDNDVAFYPSGSPIVFHAHHTVDADDANRQLVLFVTSTGNKAVEVIGDSAKLVRPVIQDSLRDACPARDEQGDAVYYLAQSQPSYALFRIRDPMQPRELLIDGLKLAGDPSISVIGKHICISSVNDAPMWVGDLPHGPLRKVHISEGEGYQTYGGIGDWGPWTSTNYFGTVVSRNGGGIAQVVDVDGNPVTEKTLSTTAVPADSTPPPVGPAESASKASGQ